MEKVIPILDLFSQTWAEYRSRWKPLILLMAVQVAGRYVLVFSAITAAVAALLGSAWSLARVKDLSLQLRQPQFLADHLAPLLIVALAGLTAWALFETWMLAALYHAAQEPSPSAGESLRAGLSHAAGFGWVLTLLSLVVAAGFLCLIVPGILFLLMFLLAPQAYFIEGKTGWAALACARQRASGKWLPLALRLGALAAAVFLGALILRALPAPFSATLFAFVAVPFAVLFQFALYRDLLPRSPETAS